MSLTLNNLIQTLNNASSSERTQLQSHSENQLKSWESLPGYHYYLQDIYLDVTLPLQTRWLAVICFKNGIDRHWRSSHIHAIQPQEKAQIRLRLFNLINEQNKQLTIQNVQAISRICRFDFPSEWPTLFEDFTSLLRTAENSGNIVEIHNVLIMLNSIVKTISSIKIGRSRSIMKTKLPSLLNALIDLHEKFFKIWTGTADLAIIEVDYMLLKNIRRILPELDSEHFKTDKIDNFMKSNVTELQMLLNEYEKSSIEVIGKFITCFAKLYLRFIEENPTAFILLSSSGDIIMTFLSILKTKASYIYDTDRDDNEFWEIVALKSFLILKRIVQYLYKKGATTFKNKSAIEDIKQSIKKITDNLFTPDLIQQLVILIIEWYFKLTPTDLEKWDQEPEEWIMEETALNYEYQIRPCAENFFQDLIKFFPDVLVDFLLNRIQNELVITSNMSGDEVLKVDSLLCVLQLSGIIFWDRISFDEVLLNNLIPQIISLRNGTIQFRVLQRRVLLIIDEWAPIQCSDESRVKVYEILIDFLKESDKDKVIQLTAINSLRYIIDDWKFVKTGFKPFSDQFIEIIIYLYSIMDSLDSKVRLLQTLSILLERSNPYIEEQTLKQLLHITQKYWQDALTSTVTNTTIHSSVLALLKNIIINLNDKSTEAYPFVLPLIESIYSLPTPVIEDVLELWSAVMHYYPSTPLLTPESFSDIDKGLLALAANLNKALEDQTEILPLVLTIIQSYSVLFPRQFFGTSFGVSLVKVIASYIPHMIDDSFDIFVDTFDLLIVVNNSTRDHFYEFFLRGFVDCSLLQVMLDMIFDEDQTINVKCKLFKLFARLTLKNFGFLLNVINSEQMVDKFLGTWTNCFGGLGNPYDKKVHLLALVHIVGLTNGNTLNVIGKYFSKVVEETLRFLEEINESEAGDCEKYHEVAEKNYQSYDDTPENCQQERIQNINDNFNPVFKSNLKNIFIESINNIKTSLDEVQFNQLIASLNTASIESLNVLVN